jgi:ADP-ribosylglycohydrolase
MNKINEAINGAYIADTYALAAHWIYDTQEIENLKIDWNEINNPQAPWHENKKAGDLTHYGDHMKILHDFLQDKTSFDILEYRNYWLNEMISYQGYKDGSTKKSFEIFQNNETVIGYESTDLSSIGRIAPLLLVSNSLEEFQSNVKAFVSMTHYSDISLKSAEFFANILYRVIQGEAIPEILSSIQIDETLKIRFENGRNSINVNTTQAIGEFGQGCPVEGGFEGVIHLLSKYSDYKEMMIANSKAGGDSAARGMLIGMILGSTNAPKNWS